MPYFKWNLCNYVGGDTAVKPSAKPYMVLDPNHWDTGGGIDGDWAAGEFTVGARDFTDIAVSVGFRPTLVLLQCFRPRNHNSTSDQDFGNRGGGATFGAFGRGSGELWDDATTYDPGDRAVHSGILYEADTTNTNDPPPSANWNVVAPVQFTGSARIQQGFDLNTGYKTWREDSCLNVVSGRISEGGPIDILTLAISTFDAGGFTLEVVENLYDQSDQVFWMALSGNIGIDIFDSGDAAVDAYEGTPGAAMFLSVKAELGEDTLEDEWDFMEGFASTDGQVSRWGGARATSWNWTTEHWRDSESICLCTAAASSGFAGASVDQLGIVAAFRAGGIDLQWPAFNGIPYRIGAILFPDGEAGYITADWTKRPEGTGVQTQITRVKPRVILMTTTNYFFNFSDPNPLNNPHSPDSFGFGGGGGFGWFLYPFESMGWGVHTYANSIQEMGHYSNSATQLQRGCIVAGAGTNSNPPTAHQHGIDVLPSPRYVGLNYRYGERHSQIKRFHTNISDRYVP